MGLDGTPAGERTRIGFFGMRNAGKSSLVNAVTGQDLAVVSETAGTTTDAVEKAMELLPLGPVVVVDTPGMDDVGDLGARRVDRARRALRSCDVAVLVVDAVRGMSEADGQLLDAFARRGVPHVVAYARADLLDGPAPAAVVPDDGPAAVCTSSLDGTGIRELKELLGALAPQRPARRLVADLVDGGDVCVLVVPIDASAPKGRIILPQQMVLRDLLDVHATAVACQPGELVSALDALRRPPALVVTDSQVFAEVARTVPADVPLTSFSMLMARYKGGLRDEVEGAAVLDALADGDRVLVSEGCTHHRQCDDIGTVKMPRWISDYSGRDLEFSFTSGGEFPEDLRGCRLVVHCGGCMLNAREVGWRLERARQQGVAFTNYGVAIAKMNGILERALSPFGRRLPA